MIVDIDDILSKLLEQEDTDGDKKITIDVRRSVCVVDKKLTKK